LKAQIFLALYSKYNIVETAKKKIFCDASVELRNGKPGGKGYYSPKKIQPVSGNSYILNKIMSNHAALSITLNRWNK